MTRRASSAIFTAVPALVCGTFVASSLVTGLLSARCDPAMAPTVERDWAHRGPEAPMIPYFSAAGQAYAEEHRLPVPPFFRHGSTAEVDPPRNVPAKAWDGPFCKTWTDQCTTCERSNDQRVSCMPSPAADAACMRHAVTCATTGIEPDDLAYRHCSQIELHRIENVHGVERDVVADQAGVRWYLARDDHRWHFFVGEDAYLPQAPRPGEPRAPKPERVTIDWRCIEAIGSPTPQGDGGDPDLQAYDPGPAIER